jgi:hypothetical protein
MQNSRDIHLRIFQSARDGGSSQMQSLEKGSFTVFGGGHFGDYVNETREELLKEKFSSELNTIYSVGKLPQ